VIVNPSTPIGPRDLKPTPTGRIVLDAAAGRMPAYVDTGLNLAHVDDVAEGHWLAYTKGRVGQRYVLGGADLSLREILQMVAGLVGRKPPRVRLPHAAVLPVAYVSEAFARLTGVPPVATVEEVRMSKKRMYFSSAKAQRELGYRARPPIEALRDAVAWYRDNGYLDRR
jgi:dihydroflavonol-4-reductase